LPYGRVIFGLLFNSKQSDIVILLKKWDFLYYKFNLATGRIIRLIKSITDVATVVKTQPWLHFLSDEPDNRIIECAVKAIAGFAVTGDKHLLNLKNYKGIKIVKLAGLLEIIKSPQSDLNG